MTNCNDEIVKITVPTPFVVGDVHMYIIKGETISLIDAGVKTNEAWELVKTQLKNVGLIPGDIEQIILTHHHPDHIGLIDQFPNAHAVYGHWRNEPWLIKDESFFNNYETFFYQLYHACGTPKEYQSFLKTLRAPLRFTGKATLTDVLADGHLLPGHSDFKVIETPGHAQSHLAFYREKDGLLIGGDLILLNSSSNPLLEPPDTTESERPKPLLQYRESLEKCLKYDVNLVLPGHGPNFSILTEIINKRLLKQEQRANRALDILKISSLSPFQLCQHLFPNHVEKQFGLTMSETIGQLDYLEEKGLVDRNSENGVQIYTAKN
ncbi:MBL fold metallo-hydrolase [Aquibacillus saliphilus]|uniref:MBL fold metallo-hydrolase n=1 Tax=Aquibacillus saliphilus TaxID=1909422 RepID=UPI001CF00AC6|nr:MBL fold metallo-hydrolase [Aquibacillus saliphilus]